ncbi:MAG TPA: LysR family transcriptional regulator [Chroococcidiopsis sp.]
MKISQLQAFVTVADHGNFSAAALQLGLSQSSVSHAIATLEEELGVVLFLRGRHGAVLTPEGEQVIAESRQVLTLLDTITHKARLCQKLQSGQVRIATVRSIASHVLPAVIEQFQRQFPAISAVITDYDLYSEVEQALYDGQAEIGFTILPAPSDFETRELLRDEFVALLPPGTLGEQETLSWDALTQLPMIMNRRSPLHNKAVHDHLAQFGHTLTISHEVREDSTVLGLVKQGLGASIMARLAAEPIPEGIQVRSLPVPAERIIGVAIAANSILPRSVFAFLDVVNQVWQVRKEG